MNSFKQAAFAVGSMMVAAMVAAGTAQAGPTLDKVKANGVVTCGVSTGVAGFSLADAQGKYTGLDVDFCKQIAAAVFGNADKVKYVPLSAQQRFTALQSGEVDLLARNTTVTLSRDTQLGLNFAPPNFFDGQGFMVFKKLGVKSAKELAGHDDGAQSCRLLPRQQARLQAGGDREAR